MVTDKEALAAAIALEDRARLERRSGDLTRARASAEQALRLYEQATGESVEVASCLHTLANIYIEVEDWNAAHAVLDRALVLTGTHLTDLRTWAAVRYTFAGFLLLAQKPDYVLTVMEDIVGKLGSTRPTSHEEAIFFNSTSGKSYTLGASALMQLGRAQDAIALLQRALPFFEACYPQGDPELTAFLAECVEHCRSIGDERAARQFEVRATAARPS